MVTPVKTFNRVQYSGSDFFSHYDEVISRMQVQFASSFNDFVLSSMAIVLIDGISFIGDTLSFYLDRRASDQYLATSRSRTAVNINARQLGYKPGGSVAASTDLQISITVPVAFPVTIDVRRQFKGPNNLIFEAAKAVTFDALAGSDAPQYLPVYEGETVTEIFNGTGLANQVFRLATVPTNKTPVQGSSRVTVNGDLWAESEFLAVESTNQYEFSANATPPVLRFGDGTAGNIPELNVPIEITYIASSGVDGRAGENTITELVDPLVVLGNEIKLSITNPQASVGGDASESLDRIKALAPKVRKTRDVAIVREDYEVLGTKFADPLFGRVAVAQAISSRSAVTDIELLNLLSSIRATLAAVAPTIQPAVASAQASSTAIQTAANASAANLQAVADKNATIKSDLEAVIGADENNGLRKVDAQGNRITAYVQAINTAASNIGPIVTDPAQRVLVDVQTAAIQVNTGAITTALGLITDVTGPAIGTLRGDVGKIVEIGTDLTSASADPNTDPYLLTVLATDNTEILTEQANIDTQLTIIGTTDTVTVGSVDADLTAISAHVSSILSAECKANLVTVPILTKDASGFFVGPSNGLIQSLQDFLDSRKEVSQTVIVVSGASSLVRAVVTIQIGVRRGYDFSTAVLSAKAVADQVLRDRKFGQWLFESEFDALIEDIPAIRYWTVRITGYLDPADGVTVRTDKVDGNGNLEISTGEIVTKGTVSVVAEADVTVATS